MRIISVTDEDGILLEQFFTDETTSDICNAIENNLAVYGSKVELDAANEEKDSGDED